MEHRRCIKATTQDTKPSPTMDINVPTVDTVTDRQQTKILDVELLST
jgi:hypothetical protein